ncbi:uncharacterized protein LOC107042276 [Diachasma alloeum]|uniref:uncharacterized protein LOC107042276 n=1 Tax=Diachasma alloeum TaxID=454923 RepID=UPI0007384EED|nr:uncharacterized protein LOC107042276 [Diachasma alloeum]
MSTMIEWLEVDVIPEVIKRIKKQGRKYKCVWSSFGKSFFLSRVFLLELIFEENKKNMKESVHLVLKCPPVTNELLWKLLDNKTYANEIVFYEKFARNSPKYPPYIYGRADDVDKTVVIMENVSRRGFKMRSQLYDIPFKYVIHAIREIGRFHGAGYVMKEKNPGKFKEIIESIQISRFVSGSRWEPLIKVVSLRPVEWLRKINHDPLFCDKMEKYLGDAFNSITLDGLTPVEPLAVLLHGDFTGSNVLFNKSLNKVETMLIDFGTICYASPAVDLSTLLFLNASSEDRKNRFDEIFGAYHESLLEYLRDAGIKDLEKFSIENMLDDYRRRAAFGYIIALFFLPDLRGYSNDNDSDDGPSRDQASIEEKARKMKAGGGDTMSEEFADMLLELRDMGCLDHVLY